MLVIEKGNIVKSVGIKFPNGKVIKPQQEFESYKYLGILEPERFVGEEMKMKVSNEYFKRLKQFLKSKLNDGTLVQGVNTWAVSLLRYLAAFISWRKCGLQAIDRNTRKFFTIMKYCNQSLMLTDYIYLEKKEGEV